MTFPQTIHFTGIGNSLIAALAKHLRSTGHEVSGSDIAAGQDITDQLRQSDIPVYQQWMPEIKAGLIITGPGITSDNPEVQYATRAGLPVIYYPKAIYELTKDRQRIVIVGSRGRTNLTALLIHTLAYFNRPLAYVAEGQIPWLKEPVSLRDAPLVIIEGTDLPGPGTRQAGFLHYQHHIGVITHIARETFYPFSGEEEYVAQLDHFADNTPKAGILLYNESHTLVSVIGAKQRPDVTAVPYFIHAHSSENGHHYVLNGSSRIPVKVFGTQNFESISAARELLKRIGLPPEKFYEALPYFTF